MNAFLALIEKQLDERETQRMTAVGCKLHMVHSWHVRAYDTVNDEYVMDCLDGESEIDTWIVPAADILTDDGWLLPGIELIE